MKEYYDNKNEVDKHYKPKVGERVFMRMPREKMIAAHPKLAFDWSGPFRVIECSDNSALITSVTAEEEPIRVQFDLLLKCPSEINDESVKVFSKRKRTRRKESICGACTAQIVMNENTSFRVEDEVSDSMHFLHVKFRCDGQPFPAIEGRAGFPLDSCRCSRSTYVRDLLPDIPPPAVDERVECVLDAARVLSIWWDVGSISLKVQRIMDKSYKALKPKAVGFAYAFFRHRCLHVAIMAGSVPQGAPFRHTLLSDWMCDSTRIKYGWRTAKKVKWSQVALTVQTGQEHSRIVLVIPEVLHRIQHCLIGSNTIVFYYKSFREVKATNTALFADDVGNVVYVLPPKEPTDPFSWLQFVNSLNLWLGAHVTVVNGPRSVELHSWDRLNEKSRSHMTGYLDTYPAFMSRLHYLIPSEPGVLSPAMACSKVGVVHDPNRWWAVEQATEFYESLRQQVKEIVQLEPLRIPKSMRPRGKPSGGTHARASGGPAIKVGGVSKRHLKRVEKRNARSMQRAAEKKLSELKMN
ncbi:Integrase catalytic domain-containing protein [Trichostrongylus colubriformis]|uniref:Integrase catalytic domain-containing protein n=1 Tax=Trichostrongylus colubriformis TaxID=6319 RepID=A0AAN8EXN4_TRICO